MVIKNIDSYMKNIELEMIPEIIILIKKYKCKYICIHNKYNNKHYIQYLDIDIDSFISFIKENKYPEQFINHVIENKERYSEIKHEITIVYNKNLEIERSAFYGIF